MRTDIWQRLFFPFCTQNKVIQKLTLQSTYTLSMQTFDGIIIPTGTVWLLRAWFPNKQIFSICLCCVLYSAKSSTMVIIITSTNLTELVTCALAFMLFSACYVFNIQSHWQILSRVINRPQDLDIIRKAYLLFPLTGLKKHWGQIFKFFSK